MELETGDQLHGFTVRTRENLPEIDGTAYVLDHAKSGAQLLYLQNADANKAFSISFKTPPADDTGVFHILEHSVLCGSDKFPVKEPFVNLLKSSMQTFLNAMTFPDKTVYPVASTNEKDLVNLMDVYMDAVLHPAIYHKRTIFEQEGWHYEVEEGDQRLALNGVVYNEMKGALSDPTSVLYDELQAALFPDTAYRFESGGTPRAIPDLTYERFLEEHARHYRLDNSYLTLYGNVDIDAMLAFLDESYLSPVADEQAASRAAQEPRKLELQAPVEHLGRVKDMATAPENACMGLGYVLGSASERTRMVAADILIDAIMGSNEAPLKRALLDADLADDAQAFVADALLQPFAVIQLRGLKEGAAARFRSVVDETLRDLAEGGLDHALVEASLSRAEFTMREHDFGMADGVALSIAALSGWLYDDDAACDYLRYEDDFAFLRGALAEGYFERLIREAFLESNHMAEVEVRPTTGDGNAFEAERLATAEANMGPQDWQHVADEQAELRRLQEEPDSPEALASLPVLSVDDLSEAPAEPPLALAADTPVPCLRHRIPTHGIAYAYRYFDLGCLSFDELPYATVLAIVLGKLATESHTAAEVDTLVQNKLGNLSFFVEVHENPEDRDDLRPLMVASSSPLSENAADLATLPNEIMLTTKLNDAAKIKDVLVQKRVGMEQGFATAGHSAAMQRAASYYLPAAVVREQLGGVDFYRFLKDLLDHYDERADDLSAKLADMAARIFSDECLTVSFTGSDGDFERYWEAGGSLGRSGAQGDASAPAGKPARLAVPAPLPKNEAFVVTADVTYVACGYDRRLEGVPYSGTWAVASRVLSFDYLWNEVRVKGGAYGTGFQATRAGNLRFYSYRDPHLAETLERFRGAGAWLAAFDPDDDQMDGYVVSTVATIDAPLKARELARRQDGLHFAHLDAQARLKTRAEAARTRAEDVRALADAVSAAAAQHAVCVFGNRDLLSAATNEGLTVIDLLNE